jgi:hypothetical protein
MGGNGADSSLTVSSTDDDACDGPRRKSRSNGERGFWISGKEMEGVIWASFLGGKGTFLLCGVLVNLVSRSLFLAVGGW